MKIEMARGDVFVFSFDILINDEKTLEVMDDIYFTVKKHYYDDTVVFQKRQSDGTIVADGSGNYIITINPDDTDNLDFGSYDFDIEIVRLPEIKRTFTGKLELMKEVTFRRNEVVQA